MKKTISSLAVVGLCASLMLTHPISVKGEQLQSFKSTAGIGNLLDPELSNDEKEELLEMAVRMLYSIRYRNYSLENARERMTIKEDAEVDLGYDNRWGITELTDKERELLADIVWLEAGNQGLVGQELIVITVLNRVVSETYDDEVVDVLSAKGQFSTWKCVDEAVPTDETYQAIEDVLSGNADDSIINAQYTKFNNEPSFGSNYIKYGDHYFYN